MAFDLKTAIPVDQGQDNSTRPSGGFDIASARSVEVANGKTGFENWSEKHFDQAVAEGKDYSKENKSLEETMEGLEVEDPGFLNSLGLLAGEATVGAAAKVFGYERDYSKPGSFRKSTGEASKVMGDIAQKHPVAAILAGTAPFIVSAPLFPAKLIGITAQFAGVSGLSEFGRQRADESLMKPEVSKALDIGKETAKGVFLGPVWHYSEGLKFVGRPFASALARAGVRGAGTTTLDAVFGNDLASAFKQGGTITALSLMFESPGLMKTVLGKGIVAHVNTQAEEKGFPKITEEGTPEEVKQSILKTTEALAGDVKGTGPQIAAAAVKVGDSIVTGTSHEDALNSAGMTFEGKGAVEGKDFEAGFLTSDNRFITRDQAKAEFGVSGSEEVEGLNQQNFLTPEKGPEVVNPETKKLMGEEGGMDVNLIPGVVEISESLKQAYDAWMKTLVPPEVGKEAKYTAQITREQLGIQARAWDKLNVAMKKAQLFFNKASKESSLDFIDKVENGIKQENPELQKTADTLRKLYDDKWAEIQATGKVAEDKFIENYFAHYWEKPNMVWKVIRQVMARRPLYGSKSFLKKRVFMTTKEGIEAGFNPVTYNPIDLTMLKIREMDKFLAAHKTRTALREQGLEKFVKIGGEHPEGWVKINDGSSDVVSKNESGELIIRGSWYTQPDAARIINNHLSPGLRGNWLFDTYRGAGNTLNQFQLGLSAFHLGFTAMDATISKVAIGLNYISAGKLATGLKKIGKAPFAPVSNFMQGRDLLQAWYGKDMGPLTNAIADAMATAGGRAKMDTFYATKAHESVTKALKEGKIFTAAMRVPMWIVEQMSRPIMEYIVPRQKMGVFVDMMKFAMERNPNMTHSELRDVAQKAWDSVDNRMGQVVYDNLFWNRTVKDLGMAEVRSLGWNLGTFREIGDGVKDLTNLKAMREGGISFPSAYLISLPLVSGLYGAIYQYLHTGKGPEELKDYFFPKNGGVDKNGEPARVSLPTYMKDIYHYSQAPVQTILNKVTPVHSILIQMLNNKDFYGTKIRNEDDPLIQQLKDEVGDLGSQFLPFGIRNIKRDTRKTIGSKIEPFFGITPAPYDINLTATEKAAMEMARAKIPVGARTKEQSQHSQAKAKLRNEYFVSKDIEPINQAIRDKIITPKEKKDIVKQSQMTSLQRLTQHLSEEEVVSLMKKASPEEKKELEKIIKKKRAGKISRGTWTESEQEMFEKQFNKN